jgi:putative CocE/NonD family hydrolase
MKRSMRARALCVVVLVVLGAAVASAEPATPTPWPGGTWSPGAAVYGVKQINAVPVVMDDGVTLHADIWYPTDLATGARASGAFPVLLTQNPYRQGVVVLQTWGNYFVPRGYIFVDVDVRGTRRSGGAYELFGARQARDGAALVEWAARGVEGSNGVVGLMGSSYLGINQIITAAMLGPGSPLKAIAPLYAADDVYREPAMTGGMPSEFLLEYAAAEAPDYVPFGAYAATSKPSTESSHVASIPTGRASSIADQEAAFTSEVLTGGARAYASGWWDEPGRARNLARELHESGIPALFWSGSHDIFPSVALRLFSELQGLAGGGADAHAAKPWGDAASAKYQMVFGQDTHAVHTYDEECMALQLEWYDTWLKGVDTGMQRVADPLHAFVEQRNEWVNLRDYPSVERYTSMYLSKDAALSSATPSELGADAIAWSPPNVAGATLAYTTPPFADGATLAGPMNATLYASADTPQVELVAHLDDVAPDGKVAGIAGGALIGSFRATDARKSWRDRDGKLVSPWHSYTKESERAVPLGSVERYDIELPPRFWAILPGHSLRLTVQTQAPQAPNTGGGGFFTTTAQTAQLAGGTYRIQRSPEFASELTLPLVAADAFAPASSGPEWAPRNWTTPARPA